MDRFLIALDLDGTLLTDEKEITNTTKDYFTELRQLGHKIVLVTGRPFRGCVNYYEELNLDTPLICNNGNVIENMGDDSFPNLRNFIDKSDADEIFKFIKDDLIMAFYNVDNNFYSYNTKGVHFDYYHIEEDTTIIDRDLDHPNNEAPILMMYFVPLSAKEKFENFMKKFPHLSLRVWGVEEGVVLYEIHSDNANKGSSLLKVAQHLKIKKENIISFGDGANDFELIDSAGHGVAMINGIEELKKTTKHHTAHTNNNDGVLNYLKEFLKKNA